MLSVKSMPSCILIPQGLDLNAYGLEVNAPTGHRSIIFPESSELKTREVYPPISVVLPRLKVPRELAPATSVINRTHLVQ